MNQEKIGKFISKIRKEKNMTQQELADKLNVTDKAISKWENGRGMPDYTLIRSLCDELGITINELLSGEKINEKDYQKKLEENIINIAIENKTIKNSFLIKFFVFIGMILIFLILYKTIKLNVPYDAKTMKCNFDGNQYTYKTWGNVLLTESYERIVDNKMYVIFHSTIYLDDIKDSQIEYGKNLHILLNEDEYAFSFFNKDFGQSITYENIIIYYNDGSLNKIKRLSDNDFELKLKKMHYMCSMK